MLTNIENRLEELFEMIEMMPPDKVELAEKVTSTNFYQQHLTFLIVFGPSLLDGRVLHKGSWITTLLGTLLGVQG